MSHFAKIENGLVINVIVAEQDFIDTLENPNEWVQTSYNTRGCIHYNSETQEPDNLPPLRANYACIGGRYDSVNDVFFNTQPYPSWHISEQTNWIWNPPTPYPSDEKLYYWDESTLNWVASDTLK